MKYNICVAILLLSALSHVQAADMDFEERECVVLGKGDKERIVYFDAKTKLHLEKYLSSRNDENPALFVTIRNPHRRLKAGGVEIMLRKMGEQCEVKHVHPHKFRRTMARTSIPIFIILFMVTSLCMW